MYMCVCVCIRILPCFLLLPLYLSPLPPVSACYITLHGCISQLLICLLSLSKKQADGLQTHIMTKHTTVNILARLPLQPRAQQTQRMSVFAQALPVCFTEWLHWSTFLPAMRKDSHTLCSTYT